MTSQEYIQLNTKIKALSEKVDELTKQVNSAESVVEADNRENMLRLDIEELREDLKTANARMSMVLLPEETRMYLTKAEISYLKDIMVQFRALKSEADTVLQSIISKSKYISSLG